MNKLDLDYQNLLKDILENGIEKETRNGKVLRRRILWRSRNTSKFIR